VSGAASVMTVQGPVSADTLGVVLPHEHLFCDVLREYRSDGLLDDRQLVTEELERFRLSGGGTVVELTGSTLGRKPEALRALSEDTGVHIVMGCGGYRDPYLADAGVDRMSVSALSERLLAEIEDGVGAGQVRPGIIGEIGTNCAWVSALEERMLRAAARAHLASGLTISLHAARWPVGRDILAVLDHEDVPHNRVVVGHLDTVDDPAYHLELARSGCYVEFDGFASASEYDVRRNVRKVTAVAEAGHLDRLLVSHDLFRLSHFQAYGGVGLSFLLDVVLDHLRTAGFAENDLHQLLVENPARALTGT
jgi:predicted metal-dependent phosphotriesterase family hydrolase